jgi:excisionase family DNA binding protein
MPTKNISKEAIERNFSDSAWPPSGVEPEQGETGGLFRGGLAAPLLVSPSELGRTSNESLPSVKQVAALLGVCTRTVYEIVQRHEIQSLRIRNIIRCRVEKLNHWMRSPEREG